MGKSRTIISGVTWTVIQNVVNILYGIISVPFLLGYFGKEDYGLIGLALSVNVYMQLLDMGMMNSNVRFFSEFIAKGDEQRVQKLFSLTYLFYAAIGLINSVVLFVVSFWVESLFKITPEQAVILRNLLWILALNATFSWVSVCFDQLLRAGELIDWIKKRATFLKLMQFLVLWMVIGFKLSIEVYFFGYIFVATFILPWTIVKAKRIFPKLRIVIGFDKGIVLTVYPYALSIFSFSIFHFLTFNFRPLLLGGLSGPGTVAEFNVMNTISMVVTVISGSFMQVLLPIVTKMSVKEEHSGIDRMINDGTKYVVILLSAIIFILILNINEIFTLYVGDEYTSLSTWMIIWLLTLLLSHRSVMTSLIFTKKRLKPVAVMGAIAMIVALLFYVTLIPKYGVGGVVIGFTAHEIIHTLFYYVFFLPRKFGLDTFRVFLKSVFPSWMWLGVTAIVIYSIITILDLSVLTSVIIKTSLCGIIFLPTIWLVIFNSKDRSFVLSLLKKK